MSHCPDLLEENACLSRVEERLGTAAPSAPVAFEFIAELEALIHSLGPRAHAVKLELICRISPEVPARVLGNPAPLFQALTLLVENAICATEQGEVLLDVYSADREVLPSPFAADWAPPEPRSQSAVGPVPFLFEVSASCRDQTRTNQLESVETAAQLIETLGDRLTERCEPGVRREWAFRLALEPAFAACQADRQVSAAIRGRSVLVVDDNATTRSLLEEFLTGWGIRVSVADSGGAALETIRQAHARATPFDALLLDARMPRLSGFEVAQHLLKNPGLCGPVLLLMPAPFRRGDEAFCRRLGVAARVGKPVRRAELLQALETVLAERNAIVTVGEGVRAPSSLMPVQASDA